MTTETKRILELVHEMFEEYRKVQRVPHYYKRHGEMVRRRQDDLVYTPRYLELFHGNAIRGHKVFKCEACGKMVDYFDLESWSCDFEEEDYICSECYAKEMGFGL